MMDAHTARSLPPTPHMRTLLLLRAAAHLRVTGVNLGLSALVAGDLVSGCATAASGAAGQRFDVDVRVESDPSKPLESVGILQGSAELGRTAADGSVRVALRGRNGDVVSLRVACPEGYASPDKPLSITLRPLVGSSVVPQYRAQCEPLLRTLVVAVRAKNGGNLPVKHLGREIARTDADGTAHALLKVPASEQVTLMLDTATPERERLRPKSPEFTLVMPARDQLAVFDQSFTEAAPPVSKRKPKATAPVLGPIKIERRP